MIGMCRLQKEILIRNVLAPLTEPPSTVSGIWERNRFVLSNSKWQNSSLWVAIMRKNSLKQLVVFDEILHICGQSIN